MTDMCQLLALAAILTACVEPDRPTRWEAAWELAHVLCVEQGDASVPRAADAEPSCEEVVATPWCASAEACQQPIHDVELYDRCLVKVRGYCWALFRQL